MAISTDGGILANSESTEINAGDAGHIEIEARQIRLEDHGVIFNITCGDGEGESISIKVADALIVSGTDKTGEFPSAISANSTSPDANAGKAGEIELQANTIELTDGGAIATSTNSASGGSITVKTPNSIYLQSGLITSSVQGGDGTGGDITIEHPVFVIMDKGIIEANAHEGTGGNIAITADQLIRSSDSTVTASSELGIDGTVNIEAPDTDISASMTVLPEKFSDASALLYDHCATRKKETTSRLVNTGLGNALMAPDDFFTDTVHQKSEKDKITPADQLPGPSTEKP